MSEISSQPGAEKSHLPAEIGTQRLEAFSDGVLAVAITIMVLNIKRPDSDSLSALKPLVPVFLVYMLSFAFIGIYWNNHHHLLRASRRISGATMWANLFLLFWISLIPVATDWTGELFPSRVPALFFGLIGFMAGMAYAWLVHTLRVVNRDTDLDRAIGADYKAWVSLGLYLLGMALAFFNPLLSYFAYGAVSLIWLIPDRRLVGPPATPAGGWPRHSNGGQPDSRPPSTR
jgi:uncharacterized membrane protein